MEQPVEYIKAPPLATLWLNRPEMRSAFDLPTLRALRACIARADRDPDIRAIVVRGRGDSFWSPCVLPKRRSNVPVTWRLSSIHRAAYLTGQVVRVNGGLHSA